MAYLRQQKAQARCGRELGLLIGAERESCGRNEPMSKPRPTTNTGYWISGGWIYHRDPIKSGKYWIEDSWIYGRAGTGDKVLTGYWIADNWILGPSGKSGDDAFTGYWINDGFIYGPTAELPFVTSTR